jgi:uncharacterized repeat protein (TIGR03806 family)
VLVLLQGQALRAQRVRWENSKVIGSPDPPLPFTVEATYTKIAWKSPLYALQEPGTNSLLVVTEGGWKQQPSRILRIEDDPDTLKAEILLEMPDRLIYSLTFHPGYAKNRQLFVFSNGPRGNANQFNRISRFHVSPDSGQTIDPTTQSTIIEWPSSAHDGGDLLFGLDGMLYISTGDGASDSDNNLTGQDISNLNAAVLRIDVDHPDDGRAYSIPPDNPFVSVKKARGECWAFGLRNPWRMSMDPKTGQIWVGDNGQDLWEMVHLIQRGHNYGWSIYEGNHPFYLQRKLGPAPFDPPLIEHHHREARSVTGGVVYYGKNLPTLNGAYVYGDYCTGKIWAARHDGQKLTWHREIADTSLLITGFAVNHREELLVLDQGSGLYRIVPAPAAKEAHEFPRKLSETGLFASVSDHRVAAGVVPYSVNSPAWTDGAAVDRYLALPGDTTLPFQGNRGWHLSDGSVVFQTLSIAGRRIETRLMTRQNAEWAGYSYLWNKEHSDAELVDRDGLDIEIPGEADAEGEKRSWRLPSRAECMSCHSRAANFLLGITAHQLHRDHDYEDGRAPQLATLKRLGLLVGYGGTNPDRLKNPYDTTHALASRVRSYLHTNCSSCHQDTGGGNSPMRLERSFDSMRLISVHPKHDAFGIQNALLVAPGAPERSILYQRISRRGPGQMPPLVTHRVDETAVKLFHEWISSLEPKRKFVRAWKVADFIEEIEKVDPAGPQDTGKVLYGELGCGQCHRIGKDGGGVGPDLGEALGPRTSAQIIEAIIEPSKEISPDFVATLIVTKKGQVVEGRVEKEDDSGLEIRTSDFFSGPVRINTGDILERTLSKNSNMPTGLLDTLTKEEVLDLLGYLLSSAKPGADSPDKAPR